MNKTKLAALLADHPDLFRHQQNEGSLLSARQLELLRQMIVKNEAALFEALKQDLGKPALEAYGGETGFVIREIDGALKNLDRWARPTRVRTPLVYLPAGASSIRNPMAWRLSSGRGTSQSS